MRVCLRTRPLPKNVYMHLYNVKEREERTNKRLK